MNDFDTSAFSLDAWIDGGRDDGNEQERQWWEVLVRPPAETNKDPREMAEQLFTDLHAHGRLSFEIHSNGPDVALKVVAGDRTTAETVARHVRGEIGGRADVREARLPVGSGDPLAAAEFSIERDVVFPLETVRTSSSEVGQLHHLLDTFAAESVRGVYQVAVEPLDGDWTARHSRGLPQSVPQEQDPEEELKRAGVAMVPVFALSMMLSPWPFETSVIVGLGLVLAATIGEGVSVPEHWTAGEIAREHRERTKERHGARSSVSKQAESACDEIIEQAGSPGWKASIRLVVSDQNRMVAADVRDSLVAEVESSFSSSVTGQSLSSTLSTGDDAREVFSQVRARHVGGRSPSEIARQLLGKGTRRGLCIGPGEFGVLGYFPGEGGGGGDSREFVDGGESEAGLAIPDAAPSPSLVDLGSDESATGLFDGLDWHIEPDNIVKKRHPEYGELPVLQIEYRPGDEKNVATCTEEVHQILREDDDFMLFGYAEDEGTIRFMGIQSDDLTQNMLVVGGAGTGKSTFAKNEAVQHAHAGRGFMVLDPHEQLVDDIQQAIPEHRQDDIVRIDPADIESAYTHVVNMLSIDTEPGDSGRIEDLDGAVGDVIGMLSQGATKIGDRMESTMKGVVRGAVKSSKEYTFADLRNILRREADRERFRQQMLDEDFKQLAEFAEDLMEMDQSALAPVIRLFDEWIMVETTRELVRHRENTLNWDEIVRGDQILLVNTHIYNDDIQKMLSTYFVKWADRACRRREPGERYPYPILIDEVDDILTDEMGLDETLGNGRKYGVSLTLLTQEPSSLSAIQDKLENNCKTVVNFRVKNGSDKRTMSDLLECDRDDVSSIGDHMALVQMAFDGDTQGPFKLNMLGPAPPTMDESERDQLSVDSKRQYGRDRSELDGVNTLRGAEPVEADGGQEVAPPTAVEEFLRVASEAARDGVLTEGIHYTWVHQGTPRERLRVNPSRSIEVFGSEDIDHPRFEEINECARGAVEDDDSYIIDHAQYTDGIGNCLGVDLEGVEHPRIDVNPRDF
ncbi:type IV secretory system conjugative DNA transfer family protein [Halocatena marina]|uniref:Type IV secretory system conjugative DNA transfer family protein n=1 Tax=Halocatena marina TaxID=2934937 RepID=A0ABD5YUG2_9EURY